MCTKPTEWTPTCEVSRLPAVRCVYVLFLRGRVSILRPLASVFTYGATPLLLALGRKLTLLLIVIAVWATTTLWQCRRLTARVRLVVSVRRAPLALVALSRAMKLMLGLTSRPSVKPRLWPCVRMFYMSRSLPVQLLMTCSSVCLDLMWIMCRLRLLLFGSYRYRRGR